MDRKSTLYDFISFKSIKICFMVQDMLYLSNCSMCIWKEWVLYFYCKECSKDVSYILWVDDVIPFYGFAAFLLTRFIGHWENSVDFWTITMGLPISHFSFASFASYIRRFVVRWIHF